MKKDVRQLPPDSIWILIDVSNGDAGYDHGSANYLWWFHTREAALKHKKEQKKKKNSAELVGPWKFVKPN